MPKNQPDSSSITHFTDPEEEAMYDQMIADYEARLDGMADLLDATLHHYF